MAVLTATSMVAIHEAKKGVHPFFENRSKSYEHVAPNQRNEPFVLNKLGWKRTGLDKGQMEDRSRIKSEEKLLEIDLNYMRRKRRKPASPDFEVAESQFVHEGAALTDDEKRGVKQCAISEALEARPCEEEFEDSGVDLHSTTANIKLTLAFVNGPTNVLPINSHADALNSNSHQSRLSDQTSQKILRLNPTAGTIGSFPSKKTSAPKAARRSRAFSNKASQLIIKIKYGADENARLSVGQKISNILHDKVAMPEGFELSNQIVSSQLTHPFFLTKSLPICEATDPVVKPVTSTKESSAPKNFTIEGARSISLEKSQQLILPSRLYSFSDVTKMEPCWPPKDMVHVRGQEPDLLRRMPGIVCAVSKKSKYLAPEPSAEDNILKTVAKKLAIRHVLDDLEQIDASAFMKPEKSLRIPKKHFMTGLDVQKRIRHELHTCFPSIRDTGEYETRGKGIHPALSKVYKLIASTSSAFDRSECETQLWTQKYAPCSASETLQIGKEPFILKDWLQTLMIMSVDDGTRSRTSSLSSKRYSSKPSKRKRKSKSGSFVISSDEEDCELDEISGPEDESSMRSPKKLRSVVRTNRNRETGKHMNAVVISGPCGCGKTAMVYAVAKELEFEVFEINASSRRNGKDILEKVGDMTRNHLVRGSENRGVNEASEEAAAGDISESQKTMNSYFKPKAKGKKQRDMDCEDQKNKRQRAQKQSLILLEEVDILFEEDKQFWTTVMTLIAQSKRPFIMTCNDEALVPLQTLPLHAIIRIGPPPLNLAVDYMLLVAAAEGHILQRQAVEALFNARRRDLRSSITELNYWCQFGVGDRRGGSDWFCPHWPPGSDIDAEGNVIRVFSEDTYLTGMGWLGRDSQYSDDINHFSNEELLHETGRSWYIEVDMTETLETPPLELLSYESFVDSMSLADLCTDGSLATDYKMALDATIPPLSAKTRDDFIVGYELLQAETRTDVNFPEEQISSNIKLRARNYVQPRDAVLSERHIIRAITDLSTENDSISRKDFSVAFDPIAAAENSSFVGSLEMSSFDRTTTMIAVDLAPFVRSIVAHDTQLQLERSRLSNLLCVGGRKGKRPRMTRSSLSALEGGARHTTLPENYFGTTINRHLVMRTGLPCWQDAAAACVMERNI